MPTSPPDILSESEEGFVDLVLLVTANHATDGNGRYFDTLAIDEGESVGLRIEMGPAWHPQQVGDIPCSSGIVTFRSMGALSDRFVSLLDRVYGMDLGPRRMVDSVSFSALTLGDDPVAVDSSLVHIKLFFESEDEANYAEVYTNIDLPRGMIQIREKDEGYRGALVRALSQAGA